MAINTLEGVCPRMQMLLVIDRHIAAGILMFDFKQT